MNNLKLKIDIFIKLDFQRKIASNINNYLAKIYKENLFQYSY